MFRYSAVVIARNEEKHIKKSVDSILNQSVRPYKVLVVDDESTDATPEILDKMPVVVKRITHKKLVAAQTHAEIRNAGFAHVQNDPVDWIYSGDADIILPPRYCETIMKHAMENDACIGAGVIHDLVELPMDGCRMIKHEWFKNVGMETKWESIYLCIMALADGKNTLVRHANDCTVITQRPLGGHTASKQYMRGMLARRMGASSDILFYCSIVCARQYGFRAGLKFYKGGLDAEIKVSKKMAQMYKIMIRSNFLRHFGRRHKMLDKRGDNLICHPPA